MTVEQEAYQDLITAFSFRLSLETNFYWKKAANRLVEVSILDYALVSDCKDEYESGLNPEEEREIKEAIIAIEKKRETHLPIPRLSVEERIELMRKFILMQTDTRVKDCLQTTLTKIIELKPFELVKNGLKMGWDLNNLTVNVNELTDAWTEFYRAETKNYVDKWLHEINAST